MIVSVEIQNTLRRHQLEQIFIHSQIQLHQSSSDDGKILGIESIFARPRFIRALAAEIILQGNK